MDHRELTHQRDWESTAIPIALIVTGFVLVFGDFIGVLSLDRIQNCWPIALISIGVLELLSPGSLHRR